MKKVFATVGMLSLAFACSLASGNADDPANNACQMGQNLVPIKNIGMYLDGYHTYKKEAKLPASKQQQIRTAHYCKQISPDMFQCIIYDGNGASAKAIGIEYVITDKLFKTLPASEQKMWHAHDSEVDTGLLTLPGLPKEKQKEILSFLRSTHGKTWQVWPDLTQSVPLGKPELMWNVDPGKINAKTKQTSAAREADLTY